MERKKTFAAFAFLSTAAAFLITLLGPALLAQRSVPPSLSDRNQPPTQALPQSNPPPAIRVESRIVVVDVTVTDNKQKPVHGLKAEAFQISEEGAPQTIRHFEEHASGKLAAFPAMPKMGPNVFTNYTPVPPGGALNVILLDALNTPTRNQLRVREQLLEYLKTIPPGTRIAIFGLNGTLSLLQGFTSDPEVLKQVIERQMGNVSAVLADPQGGSGTQNSLADTLEDNTAASDSQADLMALIVANVRQFEVDEKAADLNMRARIILDAMNQIGLYLAGLEGRKNILWFSGSFPLAMRPQDGDKSPFGVVTNYETEFRQTVKLLARAQVALYPIDSRGLFNPPSADAATSRNYSGAVGAIRAAQDRQNFFLDTSDEHSTMLELAQATGGRAFFDTNGLTDATAEAIVAGENYYTLTYSPSEPHPKSDFRNIKIQANPRGLNLSYRRGYYPDSPNKGIKENEEDPSKNGALAKAAETDSARTLQATMLRGGPAPTEVLFKVHVSTAGNTAPPEEEPAAGNFLSPKTHGPFHRYDVEYAINPGNITFMRTPEGKAHADFKLVVFVYNADGKLFNSAGNVMHLNLSAEQAAALFASQGIDAHQSVSVPVSGQYFLRIAVQDLNHDRAGAVEIATSQIKPTPSAAAAKPTSASK